MPLDPQATAHAGHLRSLAPGLEPQRDALFRAHEGFVALVGDAQDLLDECVWVVELDASDFEIATLAASSSCVVAVDDRGHEIATLDSAAVCVVLVDDEEIEL